MEAFGAVFFPDLLSLFGADVQAVLVSVMGSVKAGFTCVTLSLQLEEEVMSSGQLCCSIVWKIWSRGGAEKHSFGWAIHSIFFFFKYLCLKHWHTIRSPAELHKLSWVCHSFYTAHTCKDTHSLPVNPPCAALFTVTIIMGLIVENVADDKGHCWIPSQSICILTRRKLSQVGGKKERTCHVWAVSARGRCFDMCLCGGRGESGPLSGRKSWSSVMELRSPSILIKNT